MGSRAFSHDSIFIPDGRTESEQAIQAMSQENVLGKVKTLQVRNCKWEKYLKCGGKWSLELQNVLSVNKGGLLSGPGGLFFSCVNYLAKSCVNSLDNLQEVWVLVLKGTAVMLQAWNCMGVCILWNSYELNSWDWRLLILMPCLQMWWGKKKKWAQVTANGLQSENSLQSSFQYHFVLTTFLSQSFSPCSLGSTYKRQIHATLHSKKYTGNYIPNSVGYLLWKSFTWPAFPSFPELYPISALPKFLLYLLCISGRFKAYAYLCAYLDLERAVLEEHISVYCWELLACSVQCW